MNNSQSAGEVTGEHRRRPVSQVLPTDAEADRLRRLEERKRNQDQPRRHEQRHCSQLVIRRESDQKRRVPLLG